MDWERVPTKLGKTYGVTVAWRKPSNRAQPMLNISVSKKLSQQIGVKKEKGAEVQRVIVERNRMRGLVRVKLAEEDADRRESRAIAWKAGGFTVSFPMEDMTAQDPIPAEDVIWEHKDEWLVIKLPHWACPMIHVSGKVA